MSERHRVGARRALRFLASEGWAENDPDTLRQLLEEARGLAELVVADSGAASRVRAAATTFLEHFSADTFDPEP